MDTVSGEALYQFWNAGLVNQLPRPIESFSNWFTNSVFQVYAIPVADSPFTLNFTEDKSPLSCFAFDFNRFAISSIETRESIRGSVPEAVSKGHAWLIIQMYYAAFYSAHALLRLRGRSCSLIEQNQIKEINKVAGLFHNNPPKVSGGYYTLKLQDQNSALRFERSTTRPHQQLWKEFGLLLDEMIAELAQGSTRYQQVMLQLQTLSKILKSDNSPEGNWLSEIRDDVNYRLKYGVWFPYTVMTKLLQKTLSQKSNIRYSDSLEIDLSSLENEPIVKFLSATIYLVTLCSEVTTSIHLRVSKKSFVTDGPFKLLKLVGG